MLWIALSIGYRLNYQYAEQDRISTIMTCYEFCDPRIYNIMVSLQNLTFMLFWRLKPFRVTVG